MNDQKYRDLLWKKATKEFEDFKNDILKESKETMFESAYKIATLNDFMNMCDPECGCLSIKSVKALLKEKYPVQTLYDFYQKTDAGSIGDLYEAIWYQLRELELKNNTKQNTKKQNKDAR